MRDRERENTKHNRGMPEQQNRANNTAENTRENTVIKLLQRIWNINCDGARRGQTANGQRVKTGVKPRA